MGQYERDSDKKTFHLTATQQSKLTGESEFGSSPGTTLKDIREKKVERLPERIDRLISDIAVLSDADFFTDGWNADVWDRVRLERGDWDNWQWDSHLDRLLDFQHNQPREVFPVAESSPRQFGTELGNSMRLLFRDYLSEAEKYDLLLGFIVGLLYEEPSERYTDEQSHPRSSEVIEQLEARLQAWELLDGLQRQSGSDIQQNLRIQRNIIHICSQSAGLTISPALTDHLLEESTVPSLDINQTDQRRTQFQREVEGLISELIEKSDIDRIEELIARITESFELFYEMDGTLDVFQRVYSSEEVTSKDFSYEDSSSAMHRIRIMAGEYEYSEAWCETPLIESTSQAWTKTTWQTTAFGELVGYIQSNGKDPGWLHQKVLCEDRLSDDEDDLIQDALSELGL